MNRNTEIVIRKNKTRIRKKRGYTKIYASKNVTGNAVSRRLLTGSDGSFPRERAFIRERPGIVRIPHLGVSKNMSILHDRGVGAKFRPPVECVYNVYQAFSRFPTISHYKYCKYNKYAIPACFSA